MSMEHAHWIVWVQKIIYKDRIEYYPKCRCSNCGKVYDTTPCLILCPEQHCPCCNAIMDEPIEEFAFDKNIPNGLIRR